MTTTIPWQTMDALRDVSHSDLRRGIVRALAALREQRPQQRLFEFQALLVRTVCELGHPTLVWAAQNQTVFDVPPMGTPNAHPNEYPDNPRMLAAVWSLIEDGIIIPRFHVGNASNLNNGESIVRLSHLTLTPLGEAVVGATPDHPRFSGALKRLADRHPAMPPEISARLEDAVICINRNLARPAVVMVGQAMERALDVVADSLGQQQSRSSGRPPTAMGRIADVEKVCAQYYKGEERHKLHFACGHAEMIRERRNAAAHDGVETFDLPEADQLLVLAVGAIESFFSIIVEGSGGAPTT